MVASGVKLFISVLYCLSQLSLNCDYFYEPASSLDNIIKVEFKRDKNYKDPLGLKKTTQSLSYTVYVSEYRVSPYFGQGSYLRKDIKVCLKKNIFNFINFRKSANIKSTSSHKVCYTCESLPDRHGSPRSLQMPICYSHVSMSVMQFLRLK